MNCVHILIDFENVQPTAAEFSLIRGSQYQLTIFHGPHQNKFDAEMVRALQPLGAQVEYVQCSRKGKNALDLHLAFHLGRLIHGHENRGIVGETRYAIVSKDGDFDALVAHLMSSGYAAAKVADITEALAKGPIRVSQAELVVASVAPPAVQSKKNAAVVAPAAAKKKPTPNARQKLIDNLHAHPKSRPSNRLALERHVATMLGKKSVDTSMKELIASLERDGILTIAEKKIDYALPKKVK
jgi:hypothetical protein